MASKCTLSSEQRVVPNREPSTSRARGGGDRPWGGEHWFADGGTHRVPASSRANGKEYQQGAEGLVWGGGGGVWCGGGGGEGGGGGGGAGGGGGGGGAEGGATRCWVKALLTLRTRIY